MIELSGRLVGKQKLWLARHGACQGDPLRLPARQFVGKLVGEIRQAEPFQLRACRAIRPCRIAEHEVRKRDVLDDAQEGNQAGALKGDGNLARYQTAAAVECGPFDMPLAWPVEAGHQMQQRGFAAARGTHDGDPRALANDTGCRFQCVDIRLALADISG